VTSAAVALAEERAPERDFQRILRENSKSFALACKLLPAQRKDHVAVVYAWCRRADDAIDFASGEAQRRALIRLREELASVYAGEPQTDPTLAAFQRVVQADRIPAVYPRELLRGMEMDVVGTRYTTLEDLIAYCYRVAGTVGLMMCHVLGVSDPRALQHAAHLGIAMQLTNICRDVQEDWGRGRLYLPAELLPGFSAAAGTHAGAELPAAAGPALGGAVRELLARADRYYRSADHGLAFLPLSAALAVGTARAVYAAIGRVLRRRGYDVLAGRAVVPLWHKLLLATATLLRASGRLPRAVLRPFRAARLERALEVHDVVRL
jgi:phytoene synthase